MTRTTSPTNLPTRIGNPISFCAIALKSSKVAGVTFKFSIATSLIHIPVLIEAKKGNNYWPIKEDETNGDKKKHLTYLDGKQSSTVAFLKRLHWSYQ